MIYFGRERVAEKGRGDEEARDLMRWIVFALGLGLVIGGLAAISEGYGIVQVERGWTLVIAGTVALGTGVIVLALGVVIARIEALLTVFAASPAVSVEELLSEPEKEPSLPPVSAMQEDAAAVPSLASVGEIEDELAAVLAPMVPEPAPVPIPAKDKDKETTEPAVAAEASVEAPQKERVSLFKPPDFRRPKPRETEEAAARGSVFVPPSAVVARERPRATFVRPPPLPAKPVPAPAAKLPELVTRFPESAPSIPEPALPMPEAPQTGDKSEYDWLELALAGIESDTGAPPKVEAAETAKASTEPAITSFIEPAIASKAQKETVERNIRDSLHEPIPLRSVEPEHDAPAAIVGRYESNGASYALFADGTIEAATPTGIFRFASMSELKEFIESNE